MNEIKSKIDGDFSIRDKQFKTDLRAGHAADTTDRLSTVQFS